MDALTVLVPSQRELSIAYNSSEATKALKQKDGEFDFIVVDEETFLGNFPWEWMPLLRDHSQVSQIIVILSEKTDSVYAEIIKRLAVDLKISLIAPGLTKEEVAGEVNLRVYKQAKKEIEKKGRLITVFSSSSKDGATTVALSTAMAIAKGTSKKVGLLDLNLKSPELRDFMGVKGEKGLPLIQADMDAKLLEPETLLKACEQVSSVKNLFVLTGLVRREWAEKISVSEIAFLLQVARETFDIVFVDVHSFPDNAATVRSLLDADERWVVVSPSVASYQSSWHDWYNSVFMHYGLSHDDFKVIINRDSKELASVNEIERSMGVKVFAQVSHVGQEKGIKSLNFGEPMFISKEDEYAPFKNEINKIAQQVSQNMGITEFEVTGKKGKVKGRGLVASMFPFLIVK